jgi:hypothetical protein
LLIGANKGKHFSIYYFLLNIGLVAQILKIKLSKSHFKITIAQYLITLLENIPVMLGKPKKTEPKLFYHSVSLERRIPKEHPLRKIKQLVNFDFIRLQVAGLYGTNGNESIDPAVILKLMFLLFYENVKSERALLRQLPLPICIDFILF